MHTHFHKSYFIVDKCVKTLCISRDFTESLQRLYQMITVAQNQQDVDRIRIEIERLLSQGQKQQSQQNYGWSLSGEGNQMWCKRIKGKGDCERNMYSSIKSLFTSV